MLQTLRCTLSNRLRPVQWLFHGNYNYSSFPGVPKTLEDCYHLFYLDDTCSLEELRAAYTTTLKRYSDSVMNIKEIDKAYYRVLQDLRISSRAQGSDAAKANSPAAAEYLRNKDQPGGKTATYSGHFSKSSASIEYMVAGMIDRSMDENEVKELSGFGKPLKPKPYHANPFIDSVEGKLNEIMINQNIGTEWIEINKDIKETLDAAKYVLTDNRKKLERRSIDEAQWQEAKQEFRDKIDKVNKKVFNYNLAVPVLRMQRMGYRFERELEKLEEDWKQQKPNWKKQN